MLSPQIPPSFPSTELHRSPVSPPAQFLANTPVELPRLPEPTLEVKPVEVKPVEPVEVKPVEAKPVAPKPEPEPVLKSIDRPSLIETLNKTADRYPAIVYPGGDRNTYPARFQPRGLGHTPEVKFKTQGRSGALQQISDRKFSPNHQLYWVLPGNRIVIETQGWQGSINAIAQETETIIQQRIKATQSLWGMQAVWMIPQSFKDLISEEELATASFLSIAAEADNPDGGNAPNLIIDTSNLNPGIPRNVTSIPRLGTGTTYSPDGGGSLFNNLGIGNAPKLLQAFPTNNLQALLEGDGLFVGSVIPKEILGRAGIKFGDPITGQGFEFRPEVTSIPGIKVAQGSRFDNLDLLNVLVNPFLSKTDRDLAYLNSLHWVSLGLKPPKILSTIETGSNHYWHQLKLTRPHNRTLLQYDRTPNQATYTNIFSNPGVALSYSFDRETWHEGQSANATIGYLLGGLFELMHPYRLEKSLWEAQLRAKREDAFTPLRTPNTTADARKQINQRLDRTLAMANRTSGIEQLAGSVTFPSPIFPDRNRLFQLRAGNHTRRIRVAQVDRVWTEGDTYISKLELSNEHFGPLSFIGNLIISPEVPVTYRSSVVKVLITTADGTRQLEIGDRVDGTEGAVVPVGVRTYDMAFDRIDLSQIGRLTTTIQGYDGSASFPAIEAVLTGARGTFSYSFHGGIWGNFTAQVAPNVSRVDIGKAEPRFGLYALGSLNWESARAVLDDQKRVSAIVVSNPSLNFAFNTASSDANPNSLTASYSYGRQTANSTYSVTAGLFLAAYAKKVEPIEFLRGQLSLKNGLTITGTLDFNTKLYGAIEGVMPIGPRWSTGIYLQNFKTALHTSDRTSGRSYGLILQYKEPSGNYRMNARLGTSGGAPELRFEGGVGF